MYQFCGKQYHKSFSDHRDYTLGDIEKIKNAWREIDKEGKTGIITTEKDMVKLLDPQFEQIIKNLPIFYLPISMEFVVDKFVFDEKVLSLMNIE